jgi:hypothetical protein
VRKIVKFKKILKQIKRQISKELFGTEEKVLNLTPGDPDPR